jgi:hypothetical protein
MRIMHRGRYRSSPDCKDPAGRSYLGPPSDTFHPSLQPTHSEIADVQMAWRELTRPLVDLKGVHLS